MSKNSSASTGTYAPRGSRRHSGRPPPAHRLAIALIAAALATLAPGASAPAHAQQAEDGIYLEPIIPRLLRQAPERPVVAFGLKPMELPFRISLPAPPELEHPELWPRFEEVTAARVRRIRERATRRPPLETVVLAKGGIVSVYIDPEREMARQMAAGPDSVVYLPRDTLTRQERARRRLPGAMGAFSDLGMVISGRTELGGSWDRFEPCDISLARDCNPSRIPQLKPDMEFSVLVGGTVSDRVHVNVDYDQAREFDAANNINVFYTGQDHEIIRRIEVGDVSLRLPASRYLSRGVPAGNYGFKATGQVGPLDFQTVWAQQKGDVTDQNFRVIGADRGTEGMVQDHELALDDVEYMAGQFFYLFDPDTLPGAPHIAPLLLQEFDVPAGLRPATGGVLEVYRQETGLQNNPQQQAQLGIFSAEAVSADGSVRHAGLFRELERNADFELHPSGAWLVLRSPLGREEALAISYVTAAGDTVGTMRAAASPPDTRPEIRLVRGPGALHQPGTPTWPLEMKQVYRLHGSGDVERRSVELEISLGDISGGATFVDVEGRQVTYLRLFGLDEDSPSDQLDEARLFRPAEMFGEDTRLAGTYVIIPTLEPFAAPPPVPSEDLTAEQTLAALGSNANTDLYRNPDPVVRSSSNRFRLNMTFQVRTTGLVSSFNLGALGVREGSERIMVGERRLVPGQDYTIDYDVGLVTLTDPESVFAVGSDSEIHATWEQKAAFTIAPTSVFGLNAHFRLGERGELNFLGLHQAERALLSRPQLGLEPGTIFLGGVSGQLSLGGELLDRAVGAIPGLRASAASAAELTGELALSSPNPNRQGHTYLDDFESVDELSLPVSSRSWRLGSRPQSHIGAEEFFPSVLDVASATDLIWQSQWSEDGRVVGLMRPEFIDERLNVVGQNTGEPLLYMTFGRQGRIGEPSWRSLTTVLSTSGRDMSQSEYLEFYAFSQIDQNLAVVVDIGSVSEDAFYFDSEGNTSGSYPDGRPWGLGTLDQEGVPGEDIWGTDIDARGLWNQECAAQPGVVYSFADPLANCTRGNGVRDSEDLDGNGVLDEHDGQYFRFVVPLGSSSPYLVRDTTATGTEFRFYRIPLRDVTAQIPVNGASDGTWRFIKHLRMTIAGRPTGRTMVHIARPTITGARWPKRDVHGIMAGLTGTAPGASAGTAGFRVGPVSRLNDPAYASPPGITDRPQDPTANFGSGGHQINEKGLRLSVDALGSDERAEIYFRYMQQPQNLLDYRSLSFWVLPRSGSWGEGADNHLVIKVGTDARNQYIMRSRLAPAAAGAAVNPADWLELVADFEQWFELRAAAEDSLIRMGGSPTEPIELWNADSTYAVVMEDRARAPNLAAVRELSYAIHNSGAVPEAAEVWLNDVRLGAPTTDPGFAGTINLNVRASDFLTTSVSYSNQGPRFRPGLDVGPTYQSAGDLNVSSNLQLGGFAPAGWGLDLPIRVNHARTARDPLFLASSDLRADRLENLRETGSSSTTIGVSLRKRTPASNPWIGLLVDGVSLNANWRDSRNSALNSRNEASGFQGSISFDRRPAARGFGITPGFLESALRAILPERVEDSQAFQRFADARLRWSPAALTFRTGYNNDVSRSYRFDRILELPGDELVTPTESPRTGLASSARLGMQPFESLSAELSVNSTRDLLDAERASTRDRDRAALEGARSTFMGRDIGWERDRSVSTNVSFRPQVTNWLRPVLTYSSGFGMDRGASFIEDVVIDGDTVPLLQRQFRSSRSVGRTLLIQPDGLYRAIFGRDAPEGLLRRGVHQVTGRLQSVDLTWSNTLRSQFDREISEPTLAYQLGWGDVDAFRFMEGDTARSVAQGEGFRARSALELPLNAELAFRFDDSHNRALDIGGGERVIETRSWPDLQLNWRSVPLPSLLRGRVTQLTMSAGYRMETREDVQLSTDYRTSQERWSAPFQISAMFGRGFTTSYSGSIMEGLSRHATGESESKTLRHALTLRSTFRPPQGSQSLQRPIIASLRLSQDTQFECRTRGELECTATSDLLTRAVDLRLDTDISQVNVGVMGSYNDRKSFVGIQSGMSQFQFSVFGQFNFSAGNLPGTQGSRPLPGGR